MGGPCKSCDKVCEDTFEDCVEWETIREEERLEERFGMPTVRQIREEYADELAREPEWRDR